MIEAKIKVSDNERTALGRIIGTGIYVEACGKPIPADYVIINDGGENYASSGIKPCQDYQEALREIRRIKGINTAE